MKSMDSTEALYINLYSNSYIICFRSRDCVVASSHSISLKRRMRDLTAYHLLNGDPNSLHLGSDLRLIYSWAY